MEENSTKNILTVTETNELIKDLIENSKTLNSIFIKGEISNFTNHRTGHFYFTVKDDGSVLKAVMFKGSASKLKFIPENGMKVILHGRISLYVKDGQYQVYCDDIEPDGIGSLYIAFEQLKARLEAEGLFDPRHKKPLPKVPLKIGIITSPTGAAIRDMINVITRRFRMAKIILFPALVQGENAPQQLVSGVKFFNSKNSVDIIIIGRGGGSLEELWAFNDENLARAIFASAIPVISAVGHETDFTICDFSADLRAPTPSAAAELAVPDTADLKKQLLNVEKKIETQLLNKINYYRERINNYEGKSIFKNPKNVIDDKRMNLLHIEKNLITQMKIIMDNKKAAFALNSSKLEMLNPLSIITRGYSVAYNKNGGIVKSVKDVAPGDSIYVKLKDGEAEANITKVHEAAQQKMI